MNGNIAWMQKQGDIEPAVVFSAIAGFLFRQIIVDSSPDCVHLTDIED